MRKSKRFDTSFPIQFQTLDNRQQHSSNLINISLGGLSFSLRDPVTIGDEVVVLVSHVVPEVRLVGNIRWCRRFKVDYEVGLEFQTLEDPFLNRMIEQILEIEKYRVQQLKQFERDISSEEAAEEWIKKYAAEFK